MPRGVEGKKHVRHFDISETSIFRYVEKNDTMSNTINSWLAIDGVSFQCRVALGY